MTRHVLAPVMFAMLVALAWHPSRAAADQAPSEIASIETTAPLEEETEAGVKAAMTAAVKSAVRGAMAMGLPWVQIAGAYVRPGYVGVKVFATAKPPETDDGEADSGDSDEVPATLRSSGQKVEL